MTRYVGHTIYIRFFTVVQYDHVVGPPILHSVMETLLLPGNTFRTNFYVRVFGRTLHTSVNDCIK